jgi:septation ring formation regulator EzrA
MLAYLIIVLAIVVISFVFLGFNIFFRRKSFPETEIGRNKEMRKLGLTCPKCDEISKYRKKKTIPPIHPSTLRIIKP